MKEEVIIETEVKGADKAVKQLDQVADATKGAKDESAEYADQLKDSAQELQVFGVSINGIKGAFGQFQSAIKLSIKSLGGFKTALIATGIGAFVVLLGVLVNWMKSSQEGMDFLTKAVNVLGAAFEIVLRRLAEFGEGLILFFSGNFTEGFEKMGDAVTGFGVEMILATAQIDAMVDAMRQLEETVATNTSLTAFYELQLSKQKRIAEDITESTADRIKAQEEVIRLQGEILKANQDIADQNFAIVRDEINQENERVGRAEATTAQKQEQADAIAEIFRVQQENAEATIESNNKLNELELLALSEVDIAKSESAASSLELVTTTNDKIIEDIEATNKEAEKLQLDFGKRTIDQTEAISKINRKIAQEDAEFEADLAFSLLGSITELAGQETAAGKLLAIASAAINTEEAVTVALTAKTMVGRVLGVAFALTTGLNAIKNIQGTIIPKVQVVDTPFGDGGFLKGPSHSDGGIWVNAEGGEGIINARAMAVPWVRSEASKLNQIGGGVKFEHGGIVGDAQDLRFASLESSINAARTVLVTSDLRAVENTTLVTESIARL